MRSKRSRKDRKSTRLNSSHLGISYAVFSLKKITRPTMARSSPSTRKKLHETEMPRGHAWQARLGNHAEEAGRVLIDGRAEHHAVHHGEDAGIDAHAAGQGEDHHQ